MLTIDGSMGEGGGQILRSALALSLCTGQSFHILNLRKNRKKPGLRPQHLVAVHAAQQIGKAEVEGDTIGSQELVFIPRQVTPGEYRFSIGTAGSTTLVLQTLLPALLIGAQASRLILEGGTHNPLAPPFEFFANAFLPLINRLGPRVDASLKRYGFYPVGGGEIDVRITPTDRFRSLVLEERGVVEEISAQAVVANLPEHIAQRELGIVGKELDLEQSMLHSMVLSSVHGQGNVIMVKVKSRHVTEIFTGYGERGVRAETVAEKTAQRVRRYLSAGVPVGEYLADQMLLPLALAGGGSYVTLKPSLHTLTNIEVIKLFMNINIECAELGKDIWRIKVR